MRTEPGDAHLVRRLALGGEGPSVVVKDAIDIAGYPTMAGSHALADRPPAARHAAVVEALLAGGCRITGKANMHELAFGVTGVNDWTGTPVNPRFPGFVPGGSSSGSATAIAAGLAAFALGTDTGGSIRVPAACCGVVGLKPSFGRLSRRGLTPEASSLDCVGPLAPGMAGILRAMALLEPGFAAPALVRPPRLGWVRTEARTEAATRAALEATGCELVEAALPGLAAAFAAGMTIMNAEMHQAFAPLLGTGRLGADIEDRLRRAATIPAEAVHEAERVRASFAAETDAALAGLDALALPTLPDGAVPLDRARDAPAALAMTRLVRPFNLSGHPAIALPLPGAEPASLQLVGTRLGDAPLCAVALWVEQHLSPAHA